MDYLLTFLNKHTYLWAAAIPDCNILHVNYNKDNQSSWSIKPCHTWDWMSEIFDQENSNSLSGTLKTKEEMKYQNYLHCVNIVNVFKTKEK